MDSQFRGQTLLGSDSRHFEPNSKFRWLCSCFCKPFISRSDGSPFCYQTELVPKVFGKDFSPLATTAGWSLRHESAEQWNVKLVEAEVASSISQQWDPREDLFSIAN